MPDIVGSDRQHRVELIKSRLSLNEFSDKQIADIRVAFTNIVNYMLVYVKKKAFAEHGQGGWTRDRYTAILKDLLWLDKSLQDSITDKSFDIGTAACFLEVGAFDNIQSTNEYRNGFISIMVDSKYFKAFCWQPDIHIESLKEWADATLTKDMFDKIRCQALAGSLLGESYQKIGFELKKVYNDVDRKLIDALVHYHIASMNNTVNDDTAKLNSDIIKGLRWSAVLDKRCCVQCAALDGRKYSLDEQHPQAPLHIGCRCLMINVTKTWEELNATNPERKIRPENFKEGVPKKTNKTFSAIFREEFTRKQKTDFIGTDKLKYIEHYGLELSDLVDHQTGRLYELWELDEIVGL